MVKLIWSPQALNRARTYRKDPTMIIGCFALVEPFASMQRQFHAIREMGIEYADLTDNHDGGQPGGNLRLRRLGQSRRPSGNRSQDGRRRRPHAHRLLRPRQPARPLQPRPLRGLRGHQGDPPGQPARHPPRDHHRERAQDRVRPEPHPRRAVVRHPREAPHAHPLGRGAGRRAVAGDPRRR